MSEIKAREPAKGGLILHLPMPPLAIAAREMRILTCGSLEIFRMTESHRLPLTVP